MLSIKIPSRQSFRVITFCLRKLSAITLTFSRIGFISNHVCTLTVALRLFTCRLNDFSYGAVTSFSILCWILIFPLCTGIVLI